MQFQVISVNAKLMTRENTYKVTVDFVKFSVSGSSGGGGGGGGGGAPPPPRKKLKVAGAFQKKQKRLENITYKCYNTKKKYK